MEICKTRGHSPHFADNITHQAPLIHLEKLILYKLGLGELPSLRRRNRTEQEARYDVRPVRKIRTRYLHPVFSSLLQEQQGKIRTV